MFNWLLQYPDIKKPVLNIKQRMLMHQINCLKEWFDRNLGATFPLQRGKFPRFWSIVMGKSTVLSHLILTSKAFQKAMVVEKIVSRFSADISSVYCIPQFTSLKKHYP